MLCNTFIGKHTDKFSVVANELYGGRSRGKN